MNDLKHCESLAESLLKIEGGDGPFTEMEASRNSRESMVHTVRYSPIVLLLVAFGFLCILSLIEVFGA